MEQKIKIGVVGFSRNQFDKVEAYQKLFKYITDLVDADNKQFVEIVSGYTASGVPLLAYQIADKLGLETVGISARQALNVKSGRYPVKKLMLIGKKFGDESEKFIEYIDILIRIGGGKQSRHEVELFKKRYADQDLNQILFETEVTWFGD
jgi:orotate phosphoribosyltransferase-like protein